MAKANPFRFSTKYQDDETELLYYGYRYYSSGTGSWTARDPIGEFGGLDLYEFVRNSPIGRTDALGLSDADASNCQKQLDDYLKRFDDPKSTISLFWKQITEGAEDCPRPPISCVCCSNAKLGGEYNPNTKSITICQNSLNKGAWKEFGRRLRHELIHAAQGCRRWNGSSCRDSVCQEIQAYGGEGSGRTREQILDGVLFSSFCTCAKEVVNPWDNQRSCDDNTRGREEEVKNKIREEFNAIYDSCKDKVGKPNRFPEQPRPRL